jgi:hypothetical protein
VADRLTRLERSFCIILGVIAVGAIAVLAWRLLLGAPQDETRPFPVLGSGEIVTAPTGHAYRYIAAPDITWAAALEAAARLAWNGHRGYLATIDDPAEQRFITEQVFRKQYPDVTYLGGRQAAPGQWRWVTGPDAAADGGKGRLFWTGFEKGQAPDGTYADWMYTAFRAGGKWAHDKVCCVTMFSYRRPQFSTSLGNGEREEAVAGYLVEFGD